LCLTLGGRINVAKSLLYSQLNYIGCIIPIPNERISTYSTLIEKFVLGRLNIAKKRIYLDTCYGGLGLFEIKTFLTAQTCNWVKRAIQLDDFWKLRLYKKCYGSITNLREKSFDVTEEPILCNIAKSFEKLINCYTRYLENARVAPIFANSAIFRQQEGRLAEVRHLNLMFFGKMHESDVPIQIKSLLVSDFITNGQKKIFLDFTASKGLILNERKFRAIGDVCLQSINRYKKNDPLEKKSLDIKNFILKYKKGSKHIRAVLLIDSEANFIPHNMMKYAETTHVIINLDDSKFLNKLWTQNYFPQNFKWFIFNLHNNTLPLNNRLQHFAENINPSCTFCQLGRDEDPEDETPLHLFFQCPHSEPVVLEIQRWLNLNNGIIHPFSRNDFFTRPKTDECVFNNIFSIAMKILMKYIWDCKMSKMQPNINEAKEYLSEFFKSSCRASKKFERKVQIANINTMLG
jgi:hypothetical protein